MPLSCTKYVFSVDSRVAWCRLQRILSLRGSDGAVGARGGEPRQAVSSLGGAARGGGGPASPPASPAAACPASAAPSPATGASTATCARTALPTAPSWRAASTCPRYGAVGWCWRRREAVCGVLARRAVPPGTVAGGVGWGSPLGGCTPKACPCTVGAGAVCPACWWGEGVPCGRGLGRGAGVWWSLESP